VEGSRQDEERRRHHERARDPPHERKGGGLPVARQGRDDEGERSTHDEPEDRERMRLREGPEVGAGRRSCGTCVGHEVPLLEAREGGGALWSSTLGEARPPVHLEDRVPPDTRKQKARQHTMPYELECLDPESNQGHGDLQASFGSGQVRAGTGELRFAAGD
jgi:hypothetical protein